MNGMSDCEKIQKYAKINFSIQYFSEYIENERFIIWPNSPTTQQDLNGTLTDDTSIKWSIIKTFLFFIRV